MPTMTWPFSRRESEQRLQAVWADAEVAAGSHQRLPQLDGMDARVVQLETGLAGEREPQHVAWDAGYIGVDVLQEPRRLVEPDATQQLRRQRPGDVDRAEGQGAVENVHVETPGFDPVTDPCLGERRAARREGEHEPIAAVACLAGGRPCRRR